MNRFSKTSFKSRNKEFSLIIVFSHYHSPLQVNIDYLSSTSFKIHRFALVILIQLLVFIHSIKFVLTKIKISELKNKFDNNNVFFDSFDI